MSPSLLSSFSPVQRAEFLTSWNMFNECRDHDVFNALDIFENVSFLKPLKFGEGDGNLRYYLYNWRVVKDLNPSEVGLVLL